MSSKSSSGILTGIPAKSEAGEEVYVELWIYEASTLNSSHYQGGALPRDEQEAGQRPSK